MNAIRIGHCPTHSPPSRGLRAAGLIVAVCLAGITMLMTAGAAKADDDESSSRFSITSAEWRSSRNRLEVSGRGDRRRDVTLVNAYDPSQTLGNDRIDRGRWSIVSRRPNPVPCRVRAIQSDGQTAERDVSGAPGDCAPKSAGGGNQAPTANANGPYSGTVGTAVSFSSAGSNDPDGTIASYAWSFGDGSSGTGPNPSHTYGTAGTFTVTLTVTDNDGATASDSTSATINGQTPNNQPPTASANGPYSGTVGTAVSFSSAGSSDPDGTIASYAWTFGDGSSGSGASPTHIYNAPGTYDVTLTVTDDGGATASSTTSATITGTAATCNPADPTGISINSTSQSGCPTGHVPEQATVPNDSYSVLAINDLGMHCGDLDTRIASILPPFQVLLAQVVQKGAEPTLNPNGVSVYYSAAANPNDPILSENLFEGVLGNGDTYKTNFWSSAIAGGSYNAFYPFDIDSLMTDDLGLPVPNLETLYISNGNVVPHGTGVIEAVQHAMPGIANPYGADNLGNEPQLVQEHYTNKPFFVDFPFGYVAEGVNWFEGAGIPFSAFDDFGRENAYPLVRVQAKNAAGNVLSTVDTVLPISGEASCSNCHTVSADYTSVHGTPNRTEGPANTLANAGLPVATSLDDPESDMPPKVSLEYAADINVLRLHDLEHGADYVTPSGDGTATPAPCDISVDTDGPGNGDANCLTNKALVQNEPVVCQVCHYTPALDLAHVGPKTGPAGTEANGRNQLAHQSNSRVMHHHHGQLSSLFPTIPAPVQGDNGVITNQDERLAALENTCYQCHPGTKVQCLRGAMFNGGMVCSDCHGSMLQVGEDFSAGVSPSNPGDFALNLGDFYDPHSAQPRVPWANEPTCGSCHTGDASNNLAGDPQTLVNTRDTHDNLDNIRLRVAYRVNSDGSSADAKATPIVPTNKRFAEPAVPASFNGFPNPGAGNPQLYRVSTGHGGVMCEGCHGATHAEWPNANPSSNDNVTAKQLQGHVGTIADCTTCHSSSPGNSLGGPHGLHRIAFDSTPWSSGDVHEDRGENFSNCATCHGGSSRSNSCGTVLSRALADRSFRGRTVQAGDPVGCAVCHNSSYWESTCVNQ